LPAATTLRVSPECEILKLALGAQTLRIFVALRLQYSAAREGIRCRAGVFVGASSAREYDGLWSLFSSGDEGGCCDSWSSRFINAKRCLEEMNLTFYGCQRVFIVFADNLSLRARLSIAVNRSLFWFFLRL